MRARLATSLGLAIAVAGWCAIVAQGVLSVPLYQAKGVSTALAIVRVLSFFTILTNAIVAAVLSAPVLPVAIAGHLSSARVRGAAATYIALVGLTYSVLLRHVWDPQGLQKVLDILLHDVIPVAYLAHWIAFQRTGTLRAKDIVAWMAYPLLYLTYCLIHGAMTNWYPYYFIDANVLGYPRALLNAGGVTLVFGVIGAVIVGLDRIRPATRR